jgi:nucleoside-diphosphate-sugar epimerase
VRQHVVDLGDGAAVRRAVEAIRPRYVFHLAACGTHRGDPAADDEQARINLLGMVNLISGCEALDYAALVHTGSSAEYGPRSTVMREDDPSAPATAYGIWKAAATAYASLVGRARGRPVVTLRLFTPFGPWDRPGRLVPYVITRALRGVPLELAQPTGVRDYVYVDDVVEAYLLAAGGAATLRGEVFNIAGGRQASVAEIVAEVLELTGSPVAVRWNASPPRPWDSERWEGDVSKAAGRLGWRPRHTVREGLARAIDWYRRHLDALPEEGLP